MEKSLEHKILVALMAHKIEDCIRDVTREHGDIFKSMDIVVREVHLLALDIAEEAVTHLMTKAHQAEKRS